MHPQGHSLAIKPDVSTITGTRKRILNLIVKHTNNLEPFCKSEMRRRLFRFNTFVQERHVKNVFYQTYHGFCFQLVPCYKTLEILFILISLFHLSGKRYNFPKQVSCLN